jgi:deferrochelatase/peroxidase EfeB
MCSFADFGPANEDYHEQGVKMTPVPQAVNAPLTRAALFLVATINPGADPRSQVRSLCGDLASLVRAVGFRAADASLSCVLGIGSEACDRLFGPSRPVQLHPFREIKILRDNMPFGRAEGEIGTHFIGYSRSSEAAKQMLENMFFGKPPGNYDRLLEFSRAVTGGQFFVPSATFLDNVTGD